MESATPCIKLDEGRNTIRGCFINAVWGASAELREISMQHLRGVAHQNPNKVEGVLDSYVSRLLLVHTDPRTSGVVCKVWAGLMEEIREARVERLANRMRHGQWVRASEVGIRVLPGKEAQIARLP